MFRGENTIVDIVIKKAIEAKNAKGEKVKKVVSNSDEDRCLK